MRPVNLIPPEERRGVGAPMRTGRAPYFVIGAMAVIVVLVGLVTTTNSSLADKRGEIASLEAAQRDAQARADALRPFAEFAAAHQSRAATVESLARSRFDWQRVLDELSRVIPADIWLVQLAGTVSPAVNLEDAPGITARAEVPGPALEMIGCGRDHEAVAGFLAALRDIDGVTRVTAPSVARPEASKSTGGSTVPGATGGSSEECRTRDHVSKFEIVVAFDEVAVPAAGGTPAAPAPPAPAGTATTPSAPATSGTATDTGAAAPASAAAVPGSGA